MLQVWIQVNLLWFWGLAVEIVGVWLSGRGTRRRRLARSVRNCVGDRVGASLPSRGKISQGSMSQQSQVLVKPTMKSRARVKIEVDGRDAQSCSKYKMMKALQVTSWRVQVGL
ncbi:hypothetical protein B0F90DRAFT_1920292 [Multifurca ochricompacta]|uniref:Uncharacterized protein n=1 Tax=Multifurca ochricompacta TaxID=376703 RepID=A0AAD4LY99_9AGAM|nr:hypothetical protein B0F90DRAFT_1920292 [Multifurca ochricompacta]